MLKKIVFRFGRGESQPPETFHAQPLTVFVGPNNSGKSLVLREIQNFLQDGQEKADHKILREIEFEPFSQTDIETEIKRIQLKPHPTETIVDGHIIVGSYRNRRSVPKDALEKCLQDPPSRRVEFCEWFLQHRMLFLDGPSRIKLVNQQNAGDLQAPPSTSLQDLFNDDEKRERVRGILTDAFGEFFVIDPTNLGQLRIRMSEQAPEQSTLERGIDQAAVDFHRAATPITEKSDGVKAFTGIISEIMAGDPSVLLIDEPEAFLHPSLSFKLGKQVALQTQGTKKKVFASTHSASFVRGCIQSGAAANIVRLTYRNGKATARILQHEELVTLMRDPLLRSSSAVQGLFSEFVVVCEGDADRAFYEEINERLALVGDGRSIPNCLFLNAQNKQTVPSIVKPLRDMGIAAAGIVDLDVFKEGGQVWKAQISAAGFPTAQFGGLAATRANILQLLNAANPDWKKSGGIEILSESELEAASNLIDSLADYGLFVVRNGELESWLKYLEVPGHGPNWLINVFERMGANPEDESYVKPEPGDVWDFIGVVRSWMFKSDRKGMPA